LLLNGPTSNKIIYVFKEKLHTQNGKLLLTLTFVGSQLQLTSARPQRQLTAAPFQWQLTAVEIFIKLTYGT